MRLQTNQIQVTRQAAKWLLRDLFEIRLAEGLDVHMAMGLAINDLRFAVGRMIVQAITYTAVDRKKNSPYLLTQIKGPRQTY